MPTNEHKADSAVEFPRYLFKVELQNSVTPIERQLVVSSDICLSSFHRVIQKTMGWRNKHLYNFRIDETSYTRSDSYDYPCTTLNVPKNDLSPDDTILIDAVRNLKENDSFYYTYDFGDSWTHKITLLSKNYNSNKECFCLDGVGACPPEDVGGEYGYEEFCKIINNPHDPKYHQKNEWVYNFCSYPKNQTWPDGFDLGKVNAKLDSFVLRQNALDSDSELSDMAYSIFDYTNRKNNDDWDEDDITDMLNGIEDKIGPDINEIDLLTKSDPGVFARMDFNSFLSLIHSNSKIRKLIDALESMIEEENETKKKSSRKKAIKKPPISKKSAKKVIQKTDSAPKKTVKKAAPKKVSKKTTTPKKTTTVKKTVKKVAPKKTTTSKKTTAKKFSQKKDDK